VYGGRRPGVVLCLLDDPGTHRIQLDVTHGIDEIVRIERRREEPPLPQVTFLIPHAIDPLRVLTVYGLEQLVKSVRRRWDHDMMNVIWHQAVCDHFHGMFARVMAKQPQVGGLVAFAEEYSLPMISPLGYVMRNPRKHNTCSPWHAQQANRMLNERGAGCVRDRLETHQGERPLGAKVNVPLVPR